jgi:hypothetical protein
LELAIDVVEKTVKEIQPDVLVSYKILTNTLYGLLLMIPPGAG